MRCFNLRFLRGPLTFRSGFIGFPSVGKSTLMSRLTGQHSEGINCIKCFKERADDCSKLLRTNLQRLVFLFVLKV